MAGMRFVPFQSVIEPGFWHWLSTYKLEHLKLSEEPVDLVGSYFYDTPDAPPRLRVDHGQGKASQLPSNRHGLVRMKGILRLFNTVEAFEQFLPTFPTPDVVEEIVEKGLLPPRDAPPTFYLFVFADIKKHKFSYQFHFPAVRVPADAYELVASEALKEAVCENLVEAMKSRGKPLEGPEFVRKSGERVEFAPVNEGLKAEDGYFVLPDPSNVDGSPGWNVRTFLSLLSLGCRGQTRTVRVVCLRGMLDDLARKSYLMEVKVNGDRGGRAPSDGVKVYGWEKGGVRTVDLGSQMDPVKLADSLSALNLKLMRWQMAPDLDLERISGVKCLLLGAGTLGTYVARNLLAWGVRHVTFVDSGVVAYSNPVRQSLFEFADCKDGGRPKAEAAADALRRILPTVKSNGVVMTIPMPGHVVGGNPEEVRKDVAHLEELFDAHDVIFLLLDSREARWLPTVLGKAKEKIVLNAALGFDTYLVMRHGLHSELGCYFCTNVSAPGNSTVDRTLDQQCTVTRPGVSVIAAGLVVELMASILAHPDGIDAPAVLNEITGLETEDELEHGAASTLGIVPHTIRGFLRTFHQMTPVTPRFHQCIACSDAVVSAYKGRGAELVLDVMDDPAKLEQLTGLDKLHADCDPSEIWAYSDEESADSNDGAAGDAT